jgi:hypothetical protein
MILELSLLSSTCKNPVASTSRVTLNSTEHAIHKRSEAHYKIKRHQESFQGVI